jgi:L-fuconolactonase
MSDAGVVDAHVHVWDPRALAPDDPQGPPGTLDTLISCWDENGVAAGVAVQPSVHGSDHAYLLASLRQAPGRLAGVALAEPDDPRTLDVLAGVVAEPQVRGIRVPLIRAPDGWLGRVGEPVFELARAGSCTVCAFLRPDQLGQITPLVERFGDVPVAVDHLARLDLAVDGRDEAVKRLCELARFGNVHVKVSALPALADDPFPYRTLRPAIARVLDAFGPERLLFGSDYPPTLVQGDYGLGLEALQRALAGEWPETRDAILGGNARRLFLNGDQG